MLLLAAITDVIEGANYDETKVPQYSLPDLLVSANGNSVQNAEDWRKVRRGELLKLFEQHVYGRTPIDSVEMSFEVTEEDAHALEEKAIRKQVSVYFTKDKSGPRLDLLVYLPAKATGPVPLFVGLNFAGNHSTQIDPA
ncbi:MAG: hypothetical protein N2C12_03700, partial [Planctomycetales bacterium]